MQSKKLLNNFTCSMPKRIDSEQKETQFKSSFSFTSITIVNMGVCVRIPFSLSLCVRKCACDPVSVFSPLQYGF